MENRQKRWVVLAISLILAGIPSMLPVLTFTHLTVKTGKIPLIPYWVDILMCLTAPIAASIFALAHSKNKLQLQFKITTVRRFDPDLIVTD